MLSRHSSARPFTTGPGTGLTGEGRRLLEERVRLLESTVADLGEALRDPERRVDVVAAYQRATGELGRLQALLETAASLDDLPDDPRRVDLGDQVAIGLDDGTVETYVVVHGVEAVVDDARISVESPLGRALLGRNVGKTVEIDVPDGTYRCTILRATRRAPDDDVSRDGYG